MDTTNFIETIKWAAPKGLKLYPNMELKSVNGITGMYAKTYTPKNTVLVTYPKKSLLPDLQGYNYPKINTDLMKRLHSATKEYSKGESSEWFGLMRSMESLEDLKSTSAYFLSNDELAMLEAMSPLLCRIIQERKGIIDDQIESLLKIDPSLSKDDANVITLNFKTRAWKHGFMPIIDQFNSSDTYGAKINIGQDHVYFMTMVDYHPGDQIFMSYGTRDMYDYAIDYDFFDPDAEHSICFAIRGSQQSDTDFDTAVVRYAATKHKMTIRKTATGLSYQLCENDARFLEHAPSSKLIEYIQNTAFSSKTEFKNRKVSERSFDTRLNLIIDTLLAVNNVDNFKLEHVPAKLHRFFHLLKKEKKILLNNKKWAKFNSIHCNEIDPAIIERVNL
jgi:hypothetical protein